MTLFGLRVAAVFAAGLLFGGILGCLDAKPAKDPPMALLSVLIGALALAGIGLLWAGYYFVEATP